MIRIALVGYDHFVQDRVNVLVASPLAASIRDVVRQETLYQYAARQSSAIAMEGRAAVYVIPFGPEGIRVAVRHVMRGGFFRRLLSDRFLPPTRVLRELANSIRLRAAGIETPHVLAVVTYPAGGPFRRADVMTQYIADGADLAAVFNDARNDAQRRPILDAVAKLLTKLTSTGAQHPDLNLKNILLTSTDEGYQACVLDVDRVHFHAPGDPMVGHANLQRLTRSLRKWRERPGARREALPEEDIQYLTLAVAAQPA